MPADRSTIQRLFMELFSHHDLKIPDENLRNGTPGSLPYGSGRIMFAFGIDTSIPDTSGTDASIPDISGTDASGTGTTGTGTTGTDDAKGGAGFMEYYAHHRIGGDARGRIYEDGRHVQLPELSTMIFYNPNIPGDYERQQQKSREEYGQIERELQEVGIFSGGPVPGDMVVNSYLMRKKDEGDKEDNVEDLEDD